MKRKLPEKEIDKALKIVDKAIRSAIKVRQSSAALRENKILAERCARLQVNNRCLFLTVESLKEDIIILKQLNQQQRNEIKQLKEYAADLKANLDKRMMQGFEGTIVRKS